MSTLFEKIIAKQELIKRGIDSVQAQERAIRRKTDEELQKILDEPLEDESEE